MHSMEVENRRRILEAAEEIISQKGAAETPISEIARKAGISDSVIYQYFKGKEDLVFSIPGQRMKEILELLDEHLQGIPDPESRLSKMIWFYLRYNDTHPGYARILLMECLYSKDFYKSQGYQPVREYARIFTNILKQGMENGRFRKDLDTQLARDVILGTIGCEVFMCVAIGETESSVSDLDDIMTLIGAMLAPRSGGKLNRAQEILMAAEQVFAEKGFTKARISEIAKLANVAEGTIYEYFKNKEDLLLSVSEERFKNYLEELPQVFEIKHPVLKLKRFIRYFFSLFFRNRNFLKIFLLEIQMSFRFSGSQALQNMQRYFSIIESIVEEGKAEGVFRMDVNPRVFRNMFIGTFNNLALNWMILRPDREVDKMQKINALAELLCSAVVKSG